jgi:hypothetical protein
LNPKFGENLVRQDKMRGKPKEDENFLNVKHFPELLNNKFSYFDILIYFEKSIMCI